MVEDTTVLILKDSLRQDYLKVMVTAQMLSLQGTWANANNSYYCY